MAADNPYDSPKTTSVVPASSSPQRRSLLPLLLLHVAAAGICFAFFTIVPIGACLLVMVISGAPRGSLFFLVFVIVDVHAAAALTVFLACAALASDMLRRHCHIPLWLPPLVVFALATGLLFLIVGEWRSEVPIMGTCIILLGACIITTAFLAHWAAISTVWFLPRLLFRLFRVQHAQLKG